MIDTHEQFLMLLADFTRASGVKLEADADDTVTISAGDVEVSLMLLPQSGSLLILSTLGFLGQDDRVNDRMAYLMRLNGKPYETGGFVFSLSRSDLNRVLAHDIRDLAFFDSPDRLSVWIESLVNLVGNTRLELLANIPYDDAADDADEDDDDGLMPLGVSRRD